MRILFLDLFYEHQQLLWSLLIHLEFTMVGISCNIGTDDREEPSQPVPAPVVAATTTGDATKDLLHNLSDIRAVVTAVANSVHYIAPYDPDF